MTDLLSEFGNLLYAAIAVPFVGVILAFLAALKRKADSLWNDDTGSHGDKATHEAKVQRVAERLGETSLGRRVPKKMLNQTVRNLSIAPRPPKDG